MTNTLLSVSVENAHLEPFEDRVDTLFRELELATKWQRPSVLWAIYSSEYVRSDADTALESRLHNLGQSAYHIKIKNQEGADISLQISKLVNLDNVVVFVEGLRWGADKGESCAFNCLNSRLDFFVDHQIRMVFWLTEKEAIDLAHFAPEYWALRHRVIEFVDSPKPDQISPHILESVWQGTGEFTDTTDDLDAKIALRTALLTDLPQGNESTAARANLLLTLGMLHWRRGDYEKSTQFLNTALDQAAILEDNYFEALCFNAIALVQTSLGRIEEAIQAYQNAIGLAPDQISPWNNLGHLYRKLGRKAEALAAFERAIEHNGSDAVGWNGLGDLYHETGRNDDAVIAYLKAIEFSPDYAHSWSGMGISHLEEGRLEEALSAHQKAVTIDHRTVKSWLGLGDIYRLQGDLKKAKMAYRTALELDPKNALAWNELGNLYFSSGEHNEAMRCYQKGIELNQGCCLTYSNLASIYILKGLHTEAIPHLLKGLELSDDIESRAGLWNKLGDAYRQLDDYDNAMEAYRNADRTTSEDASPQAEWSTPVMDQQLNPSKDLSVQPVSHPELDSSEEEPLQSEPSKPAPIDSPAKSIVQTDPDSNSSKPEAEFLEWLDGLASLQDAPIPIEMNGSALINPVEGDTSDAARDSETELDNQEIKAVEPSLPVKEEYSYISELSADFPDSKILANKPSEEDTLLNSSDQPMDTTEDMQEADPAPANNDRDKTMDEGKLLNEYKEILIDNEDSSQDIITEAGDTGQAQAAINEKNAQIWNELGNIYYNTGAFDEAMHAFEMAIELDTSYGWSYYNLASVYFHFKRYADAIPLYEKSLQLLDDQKDKALLWNRLGDAYRRLNEHEQAVTAYRKAIELDPENVSLLTRARFSLLGNLRA